MPITIHSEDVKSSWLDAYGHMNEGYYLVAFSNANWALQDHFSVGPSYTTVSNRGLYTAESHIRYLKEVRAPARLKFVSYILGVDSKKIHLGHVLQVEGKVCSTVECILIHVDMQTGRACPFSEDQVALFSEKLDDQPDWVGSRVSLRRG